MLKHTDEQKFIVSDIIKNFKKMHKTVDNILIL